ncbi:hypothetical protein [Nitrosopumilus sp. S4]
MKIQLLIIIGMIGLGIIATNMIYAQCAPDPNNTRAPCYDNPTTLIIKPHEAKIESIDRQLFYSIGPFSLQKESDDRIRLHDVTFTYPSYPNPPVPGGPVSVTIAFEDGTKYSISKVGAPFPFVEFREHQDKQAGVRRNADGTFNFLLSVDIQSLSPLKQFKSGVSTDEIQCKENFVLLQKHSGSPACVKPNSVIDLIKRNWMTTEEIDGYAIDYDGDVKHLPFADICTDEMKIILLTHSNIASPDEEFVMEDVILPSGINHEDFERCALETEFTKSRWNMVAMEYPEPERTSDAEMQLYDARKSLQDAYQNHVNLGPYYMKDVVVGFGTYDDTLIVDIASKYTDSDSFQIVKQEIQHIVGKDVSVDYVVYDEPIEKHIETVIPYLWNKILHQKNIDFAPKDQTYWNNSDGFLEHDKVCSPLVAPNGTEFFISSTFDLKPFEITGTYIDKTQPEGCHKIWKTDVLMTEPDRVTALWLENEN